MALLFTVKILPEATVNAFCKVTLKPEATVTTALLFTIKLQASILEVMVMLPAMMAALVAEGAPLLHAVPSQVVVSTVTEADSDKVTGQIPLSTDTKFKVWVEVAPITVMVAEPPVNTVNAVLPPFKL